MSPKNSSGRVRISQNDVVTIVTDHNHAPNPNENFVMKINSEIRHRARTTQETPRQIIQQVTAGVQLNIASDLPDIASARHMIQRQRKKKNVIYNPVTSLADVALPDNLKKTSRHEDCLLWDSGADDPNRILLFGTSSNMDLLEEKNHWFIDGTLKIAPSIFLQVFTIHALLDDSAIPLVYALVPDKTEQSYIRILEKVKEIKPTLNPRSILSDFEKTSMNACSAVFPNACLVGCLFHLGQNLWRKIQQQNLAKAYDEDENLREHVKMIISLSFVPINDVHAAFEDLIASCPPVMIPLMDYWEDTYIRRQRRGRRATPMFAIHV